MIRESASLCTAIRLRENPGAVVEFGCSWCWEIFLFLRLPANVHLQYYTSTLKVMYSHEKLSSRRGRSQATVFRPYPLHKVRTESPVTGSLVLFVSRDACSPELKVRLFLVVYLSFLIPPAGGLVYSRTTHRQTFVHIPNLNVVKSDSRIYFRHVLDSEKEVMSVSFPGRIAEPKDCFKDQQLW